LRPLLHVLHAHSSRAYLSSMPGHCKESIPEAQRNNPSADPSAQLEIGTIARHHVNHIDISQQVLRSHIHIRMYTISAITRTASFLPEVYTWPVAAKTPTRCSRRRVYGAHERRLHSVFLELLYLRGLLSRWLFSGRYRESSSVARDTTDSEQRCTHEAANADAGQHPRTDI